MTMPFGGEIAAHLARSRESLEAARLLLDAGHGDAAASRAYYAAFHAATAALLAKGLQYTKHSAVIAAINREFVHAGLLDKHHGRSLARLFELRAIGDYGDLERIGKEDGEEALRRAREFVEAVSALCNG